MEKLAFRDQKNLAIKARPMVLAVPFCVWQAVMGGTGLGRGVRMGKTPGCASPHLGVKSDHAYTKRAVIQAADREFLA